MFKRLLAANLKLKLKKYQFFKTHLKFLGFIISKDGIFSVPTKADTIEKMKTPESLRDIQCFLEMIGYYCHFVSHFLVIATPLTQLLYKDIPFV